MPFALPHIADRLFGRPHAIDPVALMAIIDGPAGRRVLAGEAPAQSGKKGKNGRDFRYERAAAMAGRAGEVVASADGLVQYALLPSGIAMIPVAGLLTQKFDWLAAECGWTTYDGLAATLVAALDDGRVGAIMLDVDSPGGEAAGMIETAELIRLARADKPIWAVANSLAASAAYALFGAAGRCFVTDLGRVGSIGCVVVHCDQSGADRAEGLRYTAIYSGARKIDGWAHAPLSEQARSVAQAEVDFVRDKFAALVGGQGRLSAAQALATDAAVYSGENAVAAGLADGVMSLNEAIAALADAIAPKTYLSQGGTMSTAALKSSTSPAAIAAATSPATGASASSSAPAGEGRGEGASSVSPKTEMTAPAPGEKCSLCGQMMPDDEEHVKQATIAALAASAVAAAAYSVDDAARTVELCTIARATQLAAGFIAAKTPLPKVRATLLQRAADAADAVAIDAASPPAGHSEAAVAAQWDDIVGKLNASMKK